ncbi:MAG TPA: hypothetical protein VMT21_05890 [Gemmatimonadales bacterium]|nr:hypothetical protein [Gemmatimonadales bacterium]
MRWDPLQGQILRAAHRKCRAWFGARPARRSVLAALFGAAACVGVVALTSPPGPGLDPDSMSYLGAAESLARHGTLRIPMAAWSDADSTSALRHFPPGFPVVLAIPVALGADPQQAARGVEAVSALATVAVAVWVVAATAGAAAGALAGVTLLATPALVLDHARVLSEPLCLALLAASLALMVFSRRPLLYGLAAAAAGLVRYAAVPFGGAAVLWAFGLHGPVRERARRAALAAIPSVVLSGAVMLRSLLESGGARSIGLHADLGPTLRELFATLLAWLAPLTSPGLAGALLAVVVTVAAVVVFRGAMSGGPGRQDPSAPVRSLLSAAALLAACYAAFVLVSRVFVYDNIPFDDRMLSPVILLAEIAAAAALGACWRMWGRSLRFAVTVPVALWLAASAWAAGRAAADAREGGWGYASDEWRESKLGQWLRTEGRSAEIFSNDPAGIWFLTHRPSRDLPSDLAPEVMSDFASVIESRTSVIVGFASYYDRMAPPDSLASRLGLQKVAQFADGTIWSAEPLSKPR